MSHIQQHRSPAHQPCYTQYRLRSLESAKLNPSDIASVSKQLLVAEIFTCAMLRRCEKWIKKEDGSFFEVTAHAVTFFFNSFCSCS